MSLYGHSDVDGTDGTVDPAPYVGPTGSDGTRLEEPKLPEEQDPGNGSAGDYWPDGIGQMPADYTTTGWDGQPVTDPGVLQMYWLREQGYTGWIDHNGNPVENPNMWRGDRRIGDDPLPGDLTGDDLTRPVNRGTRNGRGGGSTATPESKHGQAGGAGGGGGKGGLPRKRMLGEPRKRRTSGGGGFTLFGSLINLRIGGGGIHLASGNQVGPKQIGGRPRGGAAARVARRRRRT